MDYQKFISAVTAHQSSRIKAISIPDSCAPERIPSVFSDLIPDLIEILEANFKELCNGKPMIAVFGLQATSIGIESSVPSTQRRIFLNKQTRMHLCCTLSYLPVTVEELAQKNDWSDMQSVIVDFTRGFVMDNDHYIHELFQNGALGKVYGEFNQSKLSQAWRIVRKMRFTPAYAQLN